jgi:prepilin-type N-terminal cleavage/methylation domain-containing protein
MKAKVEGRGMKDEIRNNRSMPFFNLQPSTFQKGFTLLELVIVLLLVTMVLLVSTVYFANMLPSYSFNATVRDMSATLKYARSLARMTGERQTVTIDLNSKWYGIKGRGKKDIVPGIGIGVTDPLSGEKDKREQSIVFEADGSIGNWTMQISDNKRSVKIEMDPVAGTVVVR